MYFIYISLKRLSGLIASLSDTIISPIASDGKIIIDIIPLTLPSPRLGEGKFWPVPGATLRGDKAPQVV